MKKRSIGLISGFLALALVSIACGISLPVNIPSVDTIATNVAGTMSALAPTLMPDATSEPHGLPTLEVTETLPVPPLSVAWVGPDRNAYYWNEMLSGPITLTTGGDTASAIVSPDGTLVAVTKTMDWSNYQLLIMNSDGSNQRTILDSAGFAALPRPDGSVSSTPSQVEWLPGSHTLAMNTRITFEGPGWITGEHLYLINADTDTLSQVFIGGSPWFFALSPDGSKMTISRPDGIDTYQMDGTLIADTILAYPFINTASEYSWVAQPVWSQDSSQLIAVVPPEEPWIDSPDDSTIWRVAASGLSGELVWGTTMSYFPGGFAEITPDLSKIAYLNRYGALMDNRYSINIANLDGSGLVEYATGKFFDPPAWSPDNQKFFYVDQETSAYIGEVGAAPIAMPELGKVRMFKWIDANRLVVSAGPEGGWKLLLVTVGSPTGVIYSTGLTSDYMISFTVNR